MVKRFIFLLLLLPFQVCAQGNLLSAYVDRTEVSINDVFTLTLRVNAELSDTNPNIDGLQQDFEIIGSSERNSFTFINGVSEQWSEYRISLRARSTGILTIPAFRIGNEVTMPIEITVADGIQNPVNTNDFFLTSTVSKETVYVQEQLLYTVKIYFSVPFDQGAQLGAPDAQNAVIQQLGNDISSQEVIDGLRFNVIERRFVLFPQSSGTLEIAPITFNATVGRRRSGSIFSGQMTGGRTINLSSEAHSISVQAKPDTYPTDATWLPSSNLILEENWSGSLQDLQTGEAITRNLRIRADGLSSSLLPDLPYEETETLKFYPDQPSREDLASPTGVTGIRSQGTAIVASEGGNFTLPAVEIPWWNTETDSLEYARLPEHTLSVLPSSTEITNQDAPMLPDPGINLQDEQPLIAVDRQIIGASYYWVLATVLFAIAWVYSTLMWYRSRLTLRQFASGVLTPLASESRIPDSSNHSNANQQVANTNLDAAFRNFQQSCKNAEYSEIRQNLLSWARLYFGNNAITTLDKLKEYDLDPLLQSSLDELEYSLYSPGSDAINFQSDPLLQEIRKLHKKGYKPKQKAAEHYTLPPLYKN